jgi:enoyl-CoA hydratase/carnithine racemase
MQQEIVIETTGTIASIRLNRPNVLNALKMGAFKTLCDTFRELADKDSVRVIVLTGTGRAFCAGADLNELGSTLSDGTDAVRGETLHQIQTLTHVIASSSKITIAALNGFAVGFGAEIPLACDVRVASTESYIAFPEVTRGLTQTNGSYYYLPRLVGAGRAIDLLLSGERVTAEDALSIGLVSRVFAQESFSTDTYAFASKLGAHAPISIERIKHALRKTYRWSLDEALDFEIQGMLAALKSQDLIEGVAAFHEKRTPLFTGK